jgi:CBS-domain-containing membrane protein
MKTMQVKELMVPISDYATVHEDATMAEAIRAIENEKKRYGDAPYRHQSLVVVDSKQHVVGRLSQVDMMRALEPRYNELGESRWIGRSVLSKKVLATIREQFQLWEQPLDVTCQAVWSAKVKDYMQEPTEGEFVSETDTLNIATHRIVMGRHHSLLVTRGRVIVGILRSTDLFNAIYDMMIACKCL